MPIRRYSGINNPVRIFPQVLIDERETDLYVEYNVETKLETIAFEAYGNPKYWWIVLMANPEFDMEYEIEPGDVIRVPFPLNPVVTEIKAKIKDATVL